MILNKEDNNI